jgi:hypothetical protein
VGLYGVGGIGKTTACKVLCNYLFKEFQGKVCHIELENGSDSSELEFLNLLHTMLKRFTNIKHEILMEFDIGEVCIHYPFKYYVFNMNYFYLVFREL